MIDSFRKTLNDEMRRLHAQGLDVQRKQAEPFSIEEENKLRNDSSLCSDSPGHYGVYVWPVLYSSEWSSILRSDFWNPQQPPLLT